jgi:nucleoside 2-deoxyribosyltransferase
MVCGSIGYGGINEIRSLYSFLRNEGFEVLDHIENKGMDYSDVKDFRDKKELSHEIVEHDLTHVKEADILVVLADAPSQGTAIEAFVGKKEGKKIILLVKDPMPSPWLVNFSDYIVSNQKELVELLHKIHSR